MGDTAARRAPTPEGPETALEFDCDALGPRIGRTTAMLDRAWGKPTQYQYIDEGLAVTVAQMTPEEREARIQELIEQRSRTLAQRAASTLDTDSGRPDAV